MAPALSASAVYPQVIYFFLGGGGGTCKIGPYTGDISLTQMPFKKK